LPNKQVPLLLRQSLLVGKARETEYIFSMEIRSVTLFCDPDFEPELAARFYTAA
jgi:hypothetical protein